MSDNQFIRRFFRREDDELTVHDRAFNPMLRVVAYHVVAKAQLDADVEVLDCSDFEMAYHTAQRKSLTWETCLVGHDERRQMMTSGHLFAIHHGLGDLKLVLGLIPGDGAVILRLVIRTEDIDRLPELLRWIKRLEKSDHPLKGKLFSLTATGLSFLPHQGVSRSDVIMPATVLDEVERNFTFLDEPAAFPPHLRRRAILMAGPPGVGKTMVAKWLAGRFPCTVLWTTPGGVWELGASGVFSLARKLRPTLLILEDLDVAAGDRNGRQPLGDLLGQLDGFVELEDVAVLATTNHPEVLDRALNPESRPGRFHRLLRVGPPDPAGRARLLARLTADSRVLEPVADNHLTELVDLTDGASGAQVAELVHDLESRVLWRQRRSEPASLSEVIDEVRGARTGHDARSFGFVVADRS